MEVAQANLIPVMKLNIKRNNGLDNPVQLELLARKSSYVNQQVANLLLLGSELSLVGQVLRLAAAAIRRVSYLNVSRLNEKEKGVCEWKWREEVSELSVIALFAGDAAVAEDNEAGLGDLAEALAFESKGFAHQFQG